MSLFIVPTFSDPYYEETVTLGEVPFILRFTYSVIEECWYLDIFDTARTALVEGIKVVTGLDLLKPYRYNTALPQGSLVAFPKSADDSLPTADDFGIDLRVELLFVPT